MDVYGVIGFGVQIGLLSIEIARELKSFFKENDNLSPNKANQQRIIIEALKVLEKLNIDVNREKEFSNIVWLRQFLSGMQGISDTSIQEVCGRILAQEFTSPGVTPQRMEQILSGMAFEDMQKFQRMSSMNIGIITNYNDDSFGGPNAEKCIMVPFVDSDEYSEKIGIYLEDILELQALGLLTYSSNGCYISGVPCKHPLIYANGKTFYILWHHEDEIPTGNITLTKAGRCLSNVINESEITNEYDKLVRECMEHFGVEFAEQKMYSVFKTDDGCFNLTVRRRQQQ